MYVNSRLHAPRVRSAIIAALISALTIASAAAVSSPSLGQAGHSINKGARAQDITNRLGNRSPQSIDGSGIARVAPASKTRSRIQSIDGSGGAIRSIDGSGLAIVRPAGDSERSMVGTRSIDGSGLTSRGLVERSGRVAPTSIDGSGISGTRAVGQNGRNAGVLSIDGSGIKAVPQPRQISNRGTTRVNGR